MVIYNQNNCIIEIYIHLQVLMPHLELLTEEQHQSVSTLAQSCQQAEDALTQGMLKLHQFLADTVSAGQLGEENYLQQMHSAIEKLEHLIRFVNQVINLSQLIFAFLINIPASNDSSVLPTKHKLQFFCFQNRRITLGN